MQTAQYFHRLILAVSLFLSLVPAAEAGAQDKPFDRIVVFGTSLSDPGNAFVLFSDPAAFGIQDCDLTPINVPPYDMLDDFLVPVGNYARGGHHTSNGETWAEALIKKLGMAGNAGPALRGQGLVASNYATASARARDTQSDPQDAFLPCLFNLSNQLALYFEDFPEGTSPDTLIIIEMGGNDVRDALVAALQGLDPVVVINSALQNIGSAINQLYVDGGRRFLLLNVAPVSKTPAAQLLAADLFDSFGVPTEVTLSLADDLTQGFNSGLLAILAGLPADLDVRVFDLYSMANDILEDPANPYGLENLVDACVTPNVPPFVCDDPNNYFFWDGTHPTKVVHAITAEKVAEFLEEPL